MKRFILLSFLLLLVISCSKSDDYVQFGGYAQGGVYSVKYNPKDVSLSLDQVQCAVDSILNEIDNTLSGYNKSSILSRFNSGEDPEQNDMFRELVSLADRYKEETGGALDCYAAPLFDVWGFGFEGVNFRGQAALDSAKVRMNECRTLNFNAIAQGYSCDLVASYLHSIGVHDMLVDIGEIFCEGLNPSGKLWSIGVDSPQDGNEEPGKILQAVFSAPSGPSGIVTSGNYRKFYIKDGKKYAHTIDPRTGCPVTHNLLSATIVAPTATDADAYATYCMVIGLEEAISFINARPDLEAYFIYDDAGMKEWHSDGFILH